MSETDVEPAISRPIRQYSFEAEQQTPSNTLVQALSSAVKDQQQEESRTELRLSHWETWLRLGNDTSDENMILLENQRREVVKLWDTFGHLFNRREDAGQTMAVPTIATLYEAVLGMQDSWKAQKKAGLGIVRDRFLAFTRRLDDYSYLANVIPSGDKYISLITGTVSIIVKASVNHEKIATGFSQALAEISYDLRFVQRKTKISNSIEMRNLVVELYVKVLEFLCYAMSWFSSRRKRLKTALNKKFYDEKVTLMVTGIQKTVRRIQDEAAHIAESHILDLSSEVRGINKKIDDRFDRMENHNLKLQLAGHEHRDDDATSTALKLDRVWKELGHLSAGTLGAVEQRMVHGKSILFIATAFKPILITRDVDSMAKKVIQSHLEDPGASSSEELEKEESDDSKHDSLGLRTRIDVQELSHTLLAYTEDGREEISDMLRGVSRPFLPDEVLIEVQKWIMTSQSRMIWLEGTPSTNYGSDLSLAAMHICDTLLEAGIPCVSFYCKPRYTSASASNVTHEVAATVAFLYSIITQLSRLLPASFKPVDGLNKDKFSLLDGSLGSVPIALDLIRELLIYAPPSIMWVLDGIRLMESDQTSQYLVDFIEILRDDETNRLSKVCFTTDGNSLVLNATLDITERVDASRLAQSRPGQLLRGASSIKTLRAPF